MADLQEVLSKVAEYSREELAIVRKRAEQSTPAGDHSHDYDKMRTLADELDHHAHQLRKLHDNEFSGTWREQSRQD